MQQKIAYPGLVGIILLGAVQIVAWGGSFYIMAVLAAPVSRETGWSQQWIYGALSLAILVSGMLAPLSGRIIARTGGRSMLAASGGVLAVGLALVGLSHALWLFLLAWVIIGIGMAMGLYDALFATLGTLYGATARRAITSITLISGFCTTLVWPFCALLIEWLGWRQACFAYAALLLVSVFPAYMFSLPPGGGRKISAHSATLSGRAQAVPRDLFWLLCAIFTLASVIMTAISVQLITLLQSQGYTLAAALAISAVLGPCQVASRVVDMAFRRGHPVWTTLFSVGLVALGLIVLVLFPQLAMLSMLLYGAGNGLRAIVRGTLPLALVKPEEYAEVAGRMARPALIGQALTPLAGGWVFQHFGAQVTLLLLCALALINVLLTLLLKMRMSQRQTVPEAS